MNLLFSRGILGGDENSFTYKVSLLEPRFHPVSRVFVSSTFGDLKRERDSLQAGIFPCLEELCQQEGFQYQAIDLRWGVSGWTRLNHRTIRIYFDELRRGQELSPEPNFLILLGKLRATHDVLIWKIWAQMIAGD